MQPGPEKEERLDAWLPTWGYVGRPKIAFERGHIGPVDLSKERLEQLFGDDNRVIVPNTSDPPMCAIARLTCRFGPTRIAYGTGWFISPRTLVTAGHVVYDTGGNSASSITVEPALNGVSSCTQFTGTAKTYGSGWDFSEGSAYDYAALEIDSDYSSFLNFGIFSDDQLTSLIFNLVGYPIDPNKVGCMWGTTGQLLPSSANLLCYQLGATAGQSGSPVFVVSDDGSVWAAGIHVGGDYAANNAVRINQSVFSQLKTWKAGT